MLDPNDGFDPLDKFEQAFDVEHEEPPKFPEPEQAQAARIVNVPDGEYFNHEVMVMVTVLSRNQGEAQAHVTDILRDLQDTVWVRARVVMPARYPK